MEQRPLQPTNQRASGNLASLPNRAAPLAPRPEIKAAAKLVAAPAKVPESAAIASKRKHHEVLHAQDSLHAIGTWTSELLRPAPSVSDQPPPAATVFATLRTGLADWRTRGEQACATLSEAHEAAVDDLMRGSRTLAADMTRLSKSTRREECDAAVRVRDEAHPSVLLMPGTAAATLRLPPDGQRAVPAPAGMLSL